MTARERNPFGVLGLDFGTSAAEAAAAFARLSRRVRRDPESPFTVEDLSEALHAIEHAQEDPHSTVNFYRVPANPAVFELESEASGILDPPPQPLPRTTEPMTDAEVEELHAEAICEVAGPALEALGELGVDIAYARSEGRRLDPSR